MTFQDGLIDMLERNAKKGRLVLRRGQAPDPALEARTARTPTASRPRFWSCPVTQVQFLDKPNGTNGAAQSAAAPVSGPAMPAGGAPAQTDDFERFVGYIPF